MRASWAMAATIVMAAIVSSSRGRADDAGTPRGPACTVAPYRARAVFLLREIETQVNVPHQELQDVQELGVNKAVTHHLRGMVDMLQCDEPVLTAPEIARARVLEQRGLRWADEEDERVRIEEGGRPMILRLCQVMWWKDEKNARIEEEMANRRGVVDFAKVRSLAAMIKAYDAEIATLRPQYHAFRQRPSTTWKSEGVCLAKASETVFVD